MAKVAAPNTPKKAPVVVVKTPKASRTANNRVKRQARALKACGKHLKVPRGTARAKRRDAIDWNEVRSDKAAT